MEPLGLAVSSAVNPMFKGSRARSAEAHQCGDVAPQLNPQGPKVSKK